MVAMPQTRHGRLCNTRATSLQEPYQIEYCKRYEPWGIVSRRLMPWFDERFRGYGRNKIVFVAALNATGFTCVRISAYLIVWLKRFHDVIDQAWRERLASRSH